MPEGSGQRGSGQLSFDLRPKNPYSLSYFVPHSGCAAAYDELQEGLRFLETPESGFRSLYIYGPQGCGKSHLVEGFRERALAKGVGKESFCIAELDTESWTDSLVASYISRFEKLRASGGLLVSVSRFSPRDRSENPHLLSRLLFGRVIPLTPPRDEELRPLLKSILERRNLVLSEHTIEFLLKRLPVNPLSFEDISARISELSFAEGKPAGLKVVKTALEEDTERK